MKGWVKVFSSQNTAGVSQEKGVAVIFQTVEVNGHQFSTFKNKTKTIIK